MPIVIKPLQVFYILFFLLLSRSSAICQKKKFYGIEPQIFSIIERNFKFLDIDTVSQKNDYAILRIDQAEKFTKVEYASFNNALQISLQALKDSIVRKWEYRKNFPKIIFVPLEFQSGDNDWQISKYNMRSLMDEVFRKNAPIKTESFFWAEPVVLTKSERVI